MDYVGTDLPLCSITDRSKERTSGYMNDSPTKWAVSLLRTMTDLVAFLKLHIAVQT